MFELYSNLYEVNIISFLIGFWDYTYIFMILFQKFQTYKIYSVYITSLKNINETSVTGLADFVYQISVYHNKNAWNRGKPMVIEFSSV